MEYPAPIQFHEGMAVTLILEPYRVFIQDLDSDAFEHKIFQVSKTKQRQYIS